MRKGIRAARWGAFLGASMTLLALASVSASAQGGAAPIPITAGPAVTPSLSPPASQLFRESRAPNARERPGPAPLRPPEQGTTRAKDRGDSVIQRDAPNVPLPLPSPSFEGVSTNDPNTAGVPDTNGDIGPNHYVQIVNWAWAVWNRSGTRVLGPLRESSLWSAEQPSTPCRTNDAGDPVVLYDSLADRWLLSYFAFPRDAQNGRMAPYYQCVAISQTASPLGSWWTYSFNMTNLAVTGGGFPDYPKFGVWRDGYYMSANLYPNTGNRVALGVVFERDRMMVGQSARSFGFVDTVPSRLGFLPSGHMLPADVDGTTPPPVGSPGFFLVPDPTDLFLRLYRVPVNWAAGTAQVSSQIQVPVASYRENVCAVSTTTTQCIDQPNTPNKLDPLDRDQLMHRLAYRNFGTHESAVVSQTVGVGTAQAAVRWYELRGLSGQPAVFQQGTYAPDTSHRWLPSAAMDKFGNLAVGYNVSNATNVFPSIRYAGRITSDPVGTLPSGETTLIAGSGSKTNVDDNIGRARWGDYGALAVDPTDDCTFWLTGEYLAANTNVSRWNTRVGAFKFPGCGSESPPTANLGIFPNPATPGATVTFDASTSSDQDGQIVRYEWDLDGNGSFEVSGTGASTQRSYPASTTVTVNLRVTDEDGNMDTDQEQLVVRTNTAPTADLAVSPNPADTGQSVSFNGTGSSDSDGTIAKYEWDLDGNLSTGPGGFEVDSGTDATVERTYSTPATISVRLRVTDNSGATGTDSVSLTVRAPNQGPTADLTVSPNPADTGQSVGFNGTGSSDSDGTIAKYEWDLDGNLSTGPGGFEVDSGTDATVERTYSTTATISVRLRVTDNGGASATDSAQLQIEEPNEPPEASFTFSPAQPRQDEVVTFTSTSVDPDGAIVACGWEFTGNVDFADAEGCELELIFEEPGTYPIGLGVLDNDDDADFAVANVTVLPPISAPPTAVNVNPGPTQTGPPQGAPKIDVTLSTSRSGKLRGLFKQGFRFTAACPLSACQIRATLSTGASSSRGAGDSRTLVIGKVRANLRQGKSRRLTIRPSRRVRKRLRRARRVPATLTVRASGSGLPDTETRKVTFRR